MGEFEIMKDALESTGLYTVVRNRLIYAELKAYAAALDMFFEEADELFRECFVETAESYGLELREALINRVNCLETLYGRRRAITNAASVCALDCTAEGLNKIALSFNAGGTFIYDESEQKLTFNCTTIVPPQKMALMKAQMEKFMPVWLSFEIT